MNRYMDKKITCFFFWGVVMSVLGACSHTPSAGDIPPGAEFTTKILADDTKLFTYSVRVLRAGSNGDGDDVSGDMPGRGSSGFAQNSGRRGLSEQSMLRGVEAMLAQNHYCREGFVVLEQYDEHGKYIFRGECRDAATGAERERYAPK